jgi:hypothetical protein
MADLLFMLLYFNLNLKINEISIWKVKTRKLGGLKLLKIEYHSSFLTERSKFACEVNIEFKS